MSKRVSVCIGVAVCLVLSALGWAQEDQQVSLASASVATVPRLIRIQGTVRDETGKPLNGTIGITFTLYQDENGQNEVWQETQSVSLDAAGHYSILLGSTNEAGLPIEIFSSGEARWLGIRPDGQAEQPRILFLSVAYALKAADTDMLGGKPASAFVLAGSQNSAALAANDAQVVSQAQVAVSAGLPLLASPQQACSTITSDGTATLNQVAKFTSSCNIENSAIFESGGNVGIGNTSPAGVLDVSGTAFIRGSLSLLEGAVLNPVSTATTSQAYASSPLDMEASVYSTNVSAPVDYLFRWQTTPVGNDTANSGATLNLLYGVPGDVIQTGLSIANNGIITFASGQTFPGGSGSGTVTSVGTGAGLTGGPITSSGTISIPSAGVTNSMLANNSVSVLAGSGLSGGGKVALGGTVTLAANLSGSADGMAYFSSPATVVSTAAPTNGQILIGSNGNAPVLGTLTAGSNISITNSPGEITISATGGGGGGGTTTLPYFVTGSGHTGGTQLASTNITRVWGILLPYEVTTTQISYDVSTADNTANKYDIGIFTNSGSLVVDLGGTAGTTFAPSAGFKTLPWVQGSTSLSPGRYYLAFTTNCSSSCGKIAAGTLNISFATDASVGKSSGGALPSTISPPADSWSTGTQPSIVIH